MRISVRQDPDKYRVVFRNRFRGLALFLLFDDLVKPYCQSIVVISESWPHLMLYDLALEENSPAHAWNYIFILLLIREE